MDAWDEGTRYEDYMGRWSRPMAHAFIEWLDVPPKAAWLDVGCGTGALLDTIVDLAGPERVAGIDTSPDFIAASRQRLGDLELRVGDAMALPFGPGEFDAVVSGLALNFVPDPGAAVREFGRVARKGGTAAVYVWDYSEGMEMIRTFWDVAVAVDPTIAHLDEAVRFPLCYPEPLTQLFIASGVEEVATAGLQVPTVFESFDAFWHPLLGGQGPAPSYVMSLDPAQRERLRTELRSALPESPDGSIHLTARAWAIRGIT